MNKQHHDDQFDHQACHPCHAEFGLKEDDHNSCTRHCHNCPNSIPGPCPCECNTPLTRNELMQLRAMLSAVRR